MAIAVFALLGALARLWDAPQLGLNHFDEGIYAAAGVWALSPEGLRGLDPGLTPYAPPGLAIVIGWSYRLWGISDFAAVFPSILAGSLTIAVVGRLAQRIFGAGLGAGALTAALLAAWGPHWTFSRMALTDALFLLSWTIGMVACVRLVERPAWGNATALGIAVGLAQNIKYNGWLIGVIAATAWAITLIRDNSPRVSKKEIAKSLVMLATAALIAALIYAPWYAFVETRGGGYAGLLRHHSSYVDGVAAWPRNLGAQLGQAEALARSWPLRLAALAGSTTVLMIWGRRLHSGMARLGAALAVTSLALTAPGWFAPLTWSAGAAWIVFSLRDDSPNRRAQRVLAVWWLAMTALTPLYHPYARLWLPLGVAGLMAFAGLVIEILRIEPEPRDATSRRSWIGAGGLVAVCAVIAMAVTSSRANFGSPSSPPSADSVTDGLRIATTELSAQLGKQPRPSLILSRPCVASYMALRGHPTSRLESLDAALSANPSAWLIIDSIQARQDPDWRAKLDQLRQVRPLITEQRFPVPIATLLDVDPAAAWRGSDVTPGSLWLFGGAEGVIKE